LLHSILYKAYSQTAHVNCENILRISERYIAFVPVTFEIRTAILLRPNLEGLIYENWREGEGGGMEGRRQ